MENCGLRGAAAFFMSASPTLSHDAPVHEPPDRRFPWQEQQSPRLCSVGRPLPKNTIRFKCVDCGRPMEARAQDGGVDTNCPHCAAPLTVPRIPPNPYLRPIKNIVRQMKGVPLPFPYLPQLIQLAVLTSVLALFGVLFITIGVVTQAAGVFRGLILDTRKHFCGRDRPWNAVRRRSASEFIRCSFFLFGRSSFLSLLSGQSGVRVVSALFSRSLFFSPSPTSLPCIRTI